MDKETLKIFYSQFKIIEKKMIELSDYVTIAPKNFATFSSQFIALFLLVCSEIDSFADEICKDLDLNEKERLGILNKINAILDKYPNMKNWTCKTTDDFGNIFLVPFYKFETDSSSDWWQSYNLVKHFRTVKNEYNSYNYEKANLKNILLAIAALYILIYKFNQDYTEAASKEIKSLLFVIDVAN